LRSRRSCSGIRDPGIPDPSGIIARSETLCSPWLYDFVTFPADLDTDGDGYPDSSAYVNAAAPEVESYTGVGARHHRQANVTFVDGHTEPMHIRDLAANHRDIWGRNLYDDGPNDFWVAGSP